MSTPIIHGIDNITTLMSNKLLLGRPDLVTGASIESSTTDPTATAVSAAPGSLLINSTTGNVFRKMDAGSSTNWDRISTYVAAIAESTAGNVLTNSATNYFIDFPTQVKDVSGGITGAGGGNSTTYTNTWRYVTPYTWYYIVMWSVELASSDTTSFTSAVAVNGTIKNQGHSMTNNTAVSPNKTRSSIGSCVIKVTKGDAISIVANSVTAAGISQTTVAATNRVIIIKGCAA